MVQKYMKVVLKTDTKMAKASHFVRTNQKYMKVIGNEDTNMAKAPHFVRTDQKYMKGIKVHMAPYFVRTDQENIKVIGWRGNHMEKAFIHGPVAISTRAIS